MPLVAPGFSPKRRALESQSSASHREGGREGGRALFLICKGAFEELMKHSQDAGCFSSSRENGSPLTASA